MRQLTSMIRNSHLNPGLLQDKQILGQFGIQIGYRGQNERLERMPTFSLAPLLIS